MRVGGTIVLAILSNWLFSQSAIAENRVALVIGNSAYQHVSHLTNPANDAATMTAMFRKANFDVVESRLDLSAAEMRRALRDFGDKARDADIAVVYYAGHGIEVDGTNYLIPVDAQLERDIDVYDEAFALDRVLVAVEPARQLRLVILRSAGRHHHAEGYADIVQNRSQQTNSKQCNERSHSLELWSGGIILHHAQTAHQARGVGDKQIIRAFYLAVVVVFDVI